MHVILSAPRPSEAAKLTGQIFSIIISTILDRTTGPLPDEGPTLGLGELDELDLVNDRAEVPAACTVCAAFFTGDTPAFRAPAIGIVAVLVGLWARSTLFRSLFFVS